MHTQGSSELLCRTHRELDTYRLLRTKIYSYPHAQEASLACRWCCWRSNVLGDTYGDRCCRWRDAESSHTRPAGCRWRCTCTRELCWKLSCQCSWVWWGCLPGRVEKCYRTAGTSRRDNDFPPCFSLGLLCLQPRLSHSVMAARENPSSAGATGLFFSQGGEEGQSQPFCSPHHHQSLQSIKTCCQSKEWAARGNSGSLITFKNCMWVCVKVSVLSLKKPNSIPRMVRDNKGRMKPEWNLDPESCLSIPSIRMDQVERPLALLFGLWLCLC